MATPLRVAGPQIFAVMILSTMSVVLTVYWLRARGERLSRGQVLKTYSELNRIHTRHNWASLWKVLDKDYHVPDSPAIRLRLGDSPAGYIAMRRDPSAQDVMTPVEIVVDGSRVRVLADRWSQGPRKTDTAEWIFHETGKVHDHWKIGRGGPRLLYSELAGDIRLQGVKRLARLPAVPPDKLLHRDGSLGNAASSYSSMAGWWVGLARIPAPSSPLRKVP